jgi:drug/metabolite transporter (DMT)-like permease
MCLGLFIATGSFFIGQQKDMPAFMQGSPILLLLGFAPLIAMAFWLFAARREAMRRARPAIA